MLFKAYKGKQVMTPKGVVTFRSDTLDTDDKEVIACLKGAKGVASGGGKTSPKKEPAESPGDAKGE